MPSKNILIIGASSGIGLAIAQELKQEDYQVYTASRTLSDELATLDYHYYKFDVTSDDPNIVLTDLPDVLDAVIYCPGSILLRPFHRFKSSDFLADYQLNVLGAVGVLQAVLARLKKADSASVVLFSTVASKVGMPFHASIAAAKAAVEGLARSLAAEWANANIRVNVIAPSLTDTPLAAKLLNTDAKRESAAKRHPLQSVGQTKDQAAIACFLISDAARWITGQVIGVDGGLGNLKL